jgi:fructosamine-3-kinase
MAVEMILKACELNGLDFKPLTGGDINLCYYVKDKSRRYFLKINDAGRYPEMFQKERNGLETLRDQTGLKIPTVIKTGILYHQQFLLMEWMEHGQSKTGSWKNFGEGLAGMHKRPQAYFGFDEDNYIGNLPQINTPSLTWKEFYSTCRIQPLIKMLFDKSSISRQTIKASESFSNQLDTIFPAEPAAFLHGDLWSGNFLFTTQGQAALYDPAVYYGHREMDIGMTKLFGGFNPEFYTSYQESYPLEKGWEKRLEYSQIYPLLVHAALFGGHYIQTCRDTLGRFL